MALWKGQQPPAGNGGETQQQQQQIRSRLQEMLWHNQQACVHLDKCASLASAITQTYESLFRHAEKVGIELIKVVGQEAIAADMESAIEQKVLAEYAPKDA